MGVRIEADDPRERDAAQTRIDVIQKWWNEAGEKVYREKEKAQHAEAVKRVVRRT
jgi:hypothetical protein